jgi:hypothetical protein
MSKKVKKFISPRMEIIDHFDEVINDLDIYTEVLLDDMEKRGKDKEIYTPQYFNKEKKEVDLKFPWKFADQYIDEYEYERVEDVPKPMAIKDHVNCIRAKSIVALKKARDEILAQYDANASRLKRDWSTMENVEERERLREDLFGKQFCFSLQINAPERKYHEAVEDFLMTRESQKVLPKPIFKFCILFVDFYLSKMEIVKLRLFKFLFLIKILF